MNRRIFREGFHDTRGNLCAWSRQVRSFSKFPKSVAIALHKAFRNFHLGFKARALSGDAEGAFGGFREIENRAFLGFELLKGFFGEDDAEGIADFANFGFSDYGITLVIT